MELTFLCPHCGAIGSVARLETATTAACPSCSRVRALRREAVPDGTLHSCAWCATEDLYLQKDFPQGLGLAIVIAGFVVSTIFWYYVMPIPALSVLLISALVDMVLYYWVPDVTICYRCLGQYRGPGAHPDARFRPFDLSIGERYRQERLRIEQLRADRGPAETAPPP
jgi:hypothetical protein